MAYLPFCGLLLTNTTHPTGDDAMTMEELPSGDFRDHGEELANEELLSEE